MSDPSPTPVPQVSMSNTKKEMLEAYETVKAIIAAKEGQLLDAEKAKNDLRKQVAEEIANESLRKDPLERIQELKATVVQQLNGMAEKIEAEKERYAKICEAIEDKQKEIQTLYEVETAAQDLAALIEAQRIRTEEFEQSMVEKRQTLENEIAATHSAWEKEANEYAAIVKEEKGATEKRRERDREEYEYALKREHEQRRNALEDDLAVSEKKIAATREAHEKETAEKQSELDRRETTVSEREKHVDDLQHQVDGFPRELESQINKAVEEAERRLRAEHKQQLALSTKEFEGERNVLLGRIEGLEKLTEAQARQIEQLSQQQEKAYEKVQDIANRAVEKASHIITVPTQGSSPAPGKDA